MTLIFYSIHIGHGGRGESELSQCGIQVLNFIFIFLSVTTAPGLRSKIVLNTPFNAKQLIFTPEATTISLRHFLLVLTFICLKNKCRGYVLTCHIYPSTLG